MRDAVSMMGAFRMSALSEDELMIKISSKALLGLGILFALTFASGCEDEPPPQEPVFEEGSAALLCEATQDTNEDVLVGGAIGVLDDNLESVQVSFGGLQSALALTGDALAEGMSPKDTPQTWRFSFEASKRVLCTQELVLTFIAVDADGASISTNARPAVP